MLHGRQPGQGIPVTFPSTEVTMVTDQAKKSTKILRNLFIIKLPCPFLPLQ